MTAGVSSHRAVMAQEPTVPVQTGNSYHASEHARLHQIPYSTHVLVASQLPEIDRVTITPFSANYRRRYQGSKLAKHYEIRYLADLRTWGDKPHPNAGRVVCHLSPQKIHKLAPTTRIWFLDSDQEWQEGVIQPYEDQTALKRSAEKDRKKAKEKIRKYLRLPTVWDRLDKPIL